MADKTENKIRLSKRDRWDVCWRSTFLQGSWNYERMQNGGYAYAMIPAIKKLYKNKDDQAAALKRHLEFFNTHPYLASPIIGVTLALEEDKANGAAVDDGYSLLVHGTANYCWFGGLNGNFWQYRWTNPVLPALERHADCLYVVHAGIWLPCRL